MATTAEDVAIVDEATASSPDPMARPADEEASSPDATTLPDDDETPPPDPAAAEPSLPPLPRLPSLRSASDPPAVPVMTASSGPLGALNAARRPGPPPSAAATMRAGSLPQDMQAKMKAFHLSRQGVPHPQSIRLPVVPTTSLSSSNVLRSPESMVNPIPGPLGPTSPANPANPAGPLVGGMANLRLQPPGRPQPPSWTSAPIVAAGALPPKPSLGRRRMIPPGALSDVMGKGPGDSLLRLPKLDADAGGAGAGAAASQEPNGVPPSANGAVVDSGSMFNKFADYVDTKAGTLKFAGKAVIHGQGVDFSTGSSFSISLDEVDTLEELGKGNYGTVYKVRHSRPQMRRPGMGLKGNRRHPSLSVSSMNAPASLGPEPADRPGPDESDETVGSGPTTKTAAPPGHTTGIVMAMKEIRLELEEAKFAAIIMELDILHRCISPFIVDFYGAFFQEGAVYICLEYMDGGSIDKLYGDGIPEKVLRKIALSTVMGLKTLKDEHNIIHRDVKPTNILVNTKGQVKICDFGVSGNLVASIAKTNIGCQSYMAPERIASGGVAQAGANPGGGTYSVQSDIWSLGLTIIESAMGRYPYAPETYNNIFSQLSAIVDGDPPDLPEEGFSDAARDFVRGCLNKAPKLRPTYAMLLRHPWLSELLHLPGAADAATNGDGPSVLVDGEPAPVTADEEVAEWVARAIEMRKSGVMGARDQPALHAAPLDARPQPAA